MGIAYNAGSIVRDGLVLHLDAANRKSYPGVDTNCYDLIRGTTGLNENSVMYDPDNLGSFVFDGVDSRFNFGIDNLYNISETFTLNSWINLNSVNSDTIFSRQQQTTPGFFWWMIYENKPYFQYRNSSTYVGRFDGNNTLNTNTWYMLSVVLNKPVQQFYINGIPTSTYNCSDMLSTQTSANLYFGCYASTSSTAWYADGKIPVVSIYNRALSSIEIQQNFNALRGRYGI